MKKYTYILAILSVVVVTACSPKSRSVKPAAPAKNVEVVQGEFLVKLDSAEVAKNFNNNFDVRVVDDEMNLYQFKTKSFDKDYSKTVTALESEKGVVYAEPNYSIQVDQSIPKDPKWLEMWSLKNYGQDAVNGIEGLEGADIRAMEAWSISKGSKDVIVAIIDTGIDYKHPELKDNIWINEKELGGIAGIDDDGNGYADDVYGWDFTSELKTKDYHGQLGAPDPMDDNGHGTHVAGTIGASGNNGVGIVGINWNVRMMACKFLTKKGSGSTVDAIRAIRYATKNGADIMNNSWGSKGESKALDDAIREAGKAGVLFVAAAGNALNNNDATPYFPANVKHENVLTVAATDNRDELADFSNYGYDTVHIAAPGVAITSTIPTALAKDTPPYRTFSGTSMATPHVVGAAALVLAANPSLKKNPVEIKRRLMQTVDILPQLAGRVQSGGRLNLFNALNHGKMATNSQTTGWVEEAYSLVTPQYPKERVNTSWAIKKPGAKALQVHVQKALIDDGFDVAVLYDGLYRPVTTLPGEMIDVWLPVVQGDTAHLKFSNGLVAIARFAMAPCMGDKLCIDFGLISDTYPNFASESIEIDKIRYLPGTVGE